MPARRRASTNASSGALPWPSMMRSSPRSMIFALIVRPLALGKVHRSCVLHTLAGRGGAAHYHRNSWHDRTEDGMARFELNVDGQAHSIEADPDMPLLY